MPSPNRRPPPEIPDISAAPWNNARGAVHRALMWARQAYSGLPGLHETTHLQGGADEFPAPGTPITSDPNLGPDAGDGPSYALEDHRHGMELHGENPGDILIFDGDIYVSVPASSLSEDAEFLALIGL